MNARKIGFLVLLLLVVPLAARADFSVSVGGASCSSCYGGTYTVNFIGNNAGNTFIVELKITTPTTGQAAGLYISGVNVGFGAQVTAYSPVTTTAGGSWSTVLDTLNSGQTCKNDPVPSGNKICSQQNTNTPPFQQALANGTTYTWTWTVTLNKTGDQLDANHTLIHIGAQYQAGSGSEGLIVSEEAAVPEPATVAGLGVGLALLGFRLRRTG